MRSSPDRSTKSTRLRSYGAPTACRRGVSGSFSLPSRGSFHLSFTVLCSIGHQRVFSLTGWSPHVPTGFLVSHGTLDTAVPYRFRLRGSHPLRQAFPGPFGCPLGSHDAVRTPACTHAGLGSSGFARRYSRNRFFFLFLRLLRCFSSPGSLHMPMDSAYGDRSLFCRVSPFRYLRINAHLRLPAAFRSLSRLSSAPGAKASAPRPFLLNRQLSYVLSTSDLFPFMLSVALLGFSAFQQVQFTLCSVNVLQHSDIFRCHFQYYFLGCFVLSRSRKLKIQMNIYIMSILYI